MPMDRKMKSLVSNFIKERTSKIKRKFKKEKPEDKIRIREVTDPKEKTDLLFSRARRAGISKWPVSGYDFKKKKEVHKDNINRLKGINPVYEQ